MGGSPWVCRQRALSSPRLRLVCFPFAGGGASSFSGWCDALPKGVEVLLVQPPGRESRLLEPSFRRLESLVEALRPSLDSLLDIPHAFFGHSMGAFVAFELCRDRALRGKRPPELLFVSASCAPHVPDDEPAIFSLPDGEFIQKLQVRYGGIPPEVLGSPELMELVLPNLKGDLELVETYRPALGDETLSLPIVALAGADDRVVPSNKLSQWQELTNESFQLHSIQGGHFFLSSNRRVVLEIIGEQLQRLLDRDLAERAQRKRSRTAPP